MDAEGIGATLADVHARVRRDFGEDRLHEVLRRLKPLETVAGARPPAARLKVAVLMLSHGDLAAVDRHVEAARVDHRDVLAAAFYADDL